MQCSFCKKNKCRIKVDNVTICKQCITLFYNSLQIKYSEEIKSITPKFLNDQLNKFIIGQEKSKKTLSIALYTHYKRINIINRHVMNKNNVLMIGPTGSGKTLLIKTLAKLIDLPLIIEDATIFTQVGYSGDDVNSMISRLLCSVNYDVSLAEKGIIYIDEIDKIAKKSTSLNGRDISGEGVQQALLKIIEGSNITVTVDGKIYTVDTSNILFICGGAFDGINLFSTRKSIGFNTDYEYNNSNLDIQEELKKYGLLSELLGRLPIITVLEPLTSMSMFKILTESEESSIKYYKTLFKLEGIELEFTKNALLYISEKAYKKNTGARALNSVLEEMLEEVIYDISLNTNISKIIIDEKNNKPSIIYQKNNKILDENEIIVYENFSM